MLKIGVFGASGRVGQLIIQEVMAHSKELEIGAIFVRRELDFSLPEGSFVTNNIKEFLECCSVIIDFSQREATHLLLQALKDTPKPCIIGTTGLEKSDFELLESASKKAPILYAANMSLGVAVLDRLVALVAKELKDADIEISEIHHRFKKDAPSGTALRLANTCANARGKALESVMITDRASAGERKEGQISVTSLRGGDVAGRHTVGFYVDGEYLELTHNATSRATFAKGAIKCARFIKDKKPGLYDINDVLA
ncbi:4-hydroxy-tetrahydrodipicolinate reductase [Helicobacter sp. CLO-3]|uniref:4-hydroxy-tetrahydrodipicolinate reductase n=1 Tax=unclassified Helicobacter TaxID=2593540 RepID=UPI000805729A|nr:MULTISPECIES: 4-hydroxy-tetrahydrodipicolinate reductase [unclassified Helicobacter]OBV30056.1 4-hydroxy-tetrahydrodipicolinate reductase [Helicobacter sp. CLO-3]OHU82709.1 4-hydroxy-tetrahydrodipicolinate reductase [Helicobacter sp. CLO-3]